MKKLKRFTALIGAILLFALYASTLVLAMIGSDASADLLRIAVVTTIVLPVLLWAYSLIYRVLKQRAEAETQAVRQAMPEPEDAEKNDTAETPSDSGETE